jgi:hypothetical protein
MLGNCHEGGGGSVRCDKCNGDVYPGEAHACSAGGGGPAVLLKEEPVLIKAEIADDDKPVELTTTNREPGVAGQAVSPSNTAPPPRYVGLGCVDVNILL